MLWRIQVAAHDVDDLLAEIPVIRAFAGPDVMRRGGPGAQGEGYPATARARTSQLVSTASIVSPFTATPSVVSPGRVIVTTVPLIKSLFSRPSTWTAKNGWLDAKKGQLHVRTLHFMEVNPCKLC